MEALAWIGVLIQMSAIEKAQTMAIGGKVRGYPIQYDADALSVQLIDEIHEILRGSIISRRSKVAGGLISPRAKKRVIHDRQELHMRKPHILEVSRQGLSEFAVAQRTVSFFRDASPGSKM